MFASGFREVAHTADWEIEVWAKELPDLLIQAARGMYVLSGVRLAGRGRRASRGLSIPAVNPEQLLVRFLSELLHYAEQERLGFDQLDIEIGPGVHEGSLEASARLAGRRIKVQDKEIKAVTYHNLSIRQTPEGLIVNVVFDV